MKKIFEIGMINMILSVFTLQAIASVCSSPPSSVKPSLSASVNFDKKKQMYKYQYKIKNGSDAQIPLDYFGLLMNQAPELFSSGKYWGGKFISLSYAPKNFRWTTDAVDDPNRVTGDGKLSTPSYAIKPGTSLGGFEIWSAQPPGISQFYAEGFTQPLTSSSTTEADEVIPDCPGWDFENPKIQTQVTGMTIGPSDPAIISVRIRAREEKGLRSSEPIDPKKPSGKISVLVLSTSTFDSTQIDVTNVVLGPGYAKPLSSKVVEPGIGEKLESEKLTDWEKFNEEANPKEANHRKVKNKNILLTFDVASLDVQCNLDQALFLRGKTKAGQQFVGAFSARVVGCGPKDFGKHKRHEVPTWLKN